MSNEQNIDTNASNMEHCYENLILIDCGSNLANKKYGRDLDQVLKRAKDAGKWGVWFLNHLETNAIFRRRAKNYCSRKLCEGK